MVSRNDVVYAYRLLLGREPENRSIVKAAAASHANLKHLRETFLASNEFAPFAAAAATKRFPLDLEQPGLIEVSCDPRSLQRLVARVERIWTNLGKKEPYWSVITQDIFKKDNFQDNRDVYWSSGQSETLRLDAWLKRNGIQPRPEWTCLEYGCGTGRITRWLAKEFENVIGCDISESHLAAARESLTADLGSRVQFLRIESLAGLSQLPEYDVLFSVLVLQHNPPPLISYILDKLLGHLRPGGIAFFQVPTFRLGYRFEVAKYLAERDADVMEMHVFPQKNLFELIRNQQCDLLEIQPDDRPGPEYVSNTVLLRKSA